MHGCSFRKFEGYLELTGWDVYNFPREMDRQGVSGGRSGLLSPATRSPGHARQREDNNLFLPRFSWVVFLLLQVSEEKWLLTVINGPEYFLCSSYPQLLYVPATAKEVNTHRCTAIIMLFTALCFLVALKFGLFATGLDPYGVSKVSQQGVHS